MKNGVGGQLAGDRSYRIHESYQPMIDELAEDERRTFDC
jgi:hypothetical protein